jgi:hypothetical protein
VNRGAYVAGVIAVLASMAAVVFLRAYADAAFLAAWGARGLPWLLAATTLGFVSATATYNALSRRVPGALLDGVLGLVLLGAVIAAPGVFATGRVALFAWAILLASLASLLSLAAWNAVAGTVRGRAARTALPRAGAAATAGAMGAGFLGVWIVHAAGSRVLPAVILGFAALSVCARAEIARRLHAQPVPVVARPRRASPLGAETRALVIALALCALLEAATGAVAEYSFKAELAHRFERDAIAAWLSLFFGLSNACVLVLQMLVVPRVLAARSLTFTFSFQPWAMLVAFTGMLVLPGYAAATVARLLDQILKFSLSRGSQEVALAPLAPAEQARSKVLLRGGATQVGAAAVALSLIPVPDLALRAPWIVAGAGFVLAGGWVWAIRRAAHAYLVALGATLGVRRLPSSGDRATAAGIDREGLGAIIERIGSGDAQAARFGRAVLARVVTRAAELAPHLGHPRPAVRAALYAELEEREADHTALPALRAAVVAEAETDGSALAAGLGALGAHDDGAAIEIARRHAPREGPLATAARAYLTELGEATAEQAWLACAEQLVEQGHRAARIARRELRRGRRRPMELELLLAEALAAREPARRREACRAAAAATPTLSGRTLLAALLAGEAGAAPAMAEVSERGLSELCNAAAGFGADAGRVRARLARALRSSDLPAAEDRLVDWLSDADAGVREAAARSLAKRARDGRGAPPPAAVDRATRAELGRLGAYVAARAPAGARPVWHEDELARQTQHCLERALELVALAGNPATVVAAARRLRSSDEGDRRGGLDLLQEVARGETRRRLLAVVDAYLTPPAELPPEVAVAAMRAIDPWLDRVLGGGLDGESWRLAALRRTPLFDAVPGEALGDLAHIGRLEAVLKGKVIMREGEPGDALFVVHSGRLRARRDGAPLSDLGPGDGFGELALVDGGPRTATVEAVEDAQLLRLPRDAFLAVLAARPELGLGLLQALARWLRGARPT